MKLGILPKLLQNLFTKPMTVRFPQESIPIPDGYRGEHKYDIDKCIETAKVVADRRNHQLSDPELELIRSVFNNEDSEEGLLNLE